MKFLSLISIAVFLFSTKSLATESFEAKIEITTSGSLNVEITKEVNIYGDAAKQLYNFLNAPAALSEIEKTWDYKYAKNIICGKEINKQIYVCTLYLNADGVSE